MREALPTVHTIPGLCTKGHRVTFKDPVSKSHTYNTKDTPHLLGIRDQHLADMGILDTQATCLLIETKDARLAGLPTLGTSNKKIAVAENTLIRASHKTRLPYNLLLRNMEGDVVPTFINSLIGFKTFADAGCIRIFHPHQGGITIHHQDDFQINIFHPQSSKELERKQGSGEYHPPTTPHTKKTNQKKKGVNRHT